MTSAGRAYVVAATLFVFFVLWAAIAASPWRSARPDPRVAALTAREASLRQAAADAQARHAVRWAAYRAALASRRADATTLAAARAQPTVRIVQLPAATTTRSS